METHRVKKDNLVTTSTTRSTRKPTNADKTVPPQESKDSIDSGEILGGDTVIEPVDRIFSDVPRKKRARRDSINSSAKKQARMIPEKDEDGFPKPIRAIPDVCKQFWKAGDYEGKNGGDWEVSAGGFDHVRVHPKFLHSNATSHKWSLGAFAELLDNALDEVRSGATYVNIDMIQNKKDGNKMVLIEDNGGGMNPEKMRHCMSLGYSAKSKIADTIGQYGNGFKTSTMRLGADVIVFSRCNGTQSIGLLSYTFLKSTGKEDIVVPMLDYERRGSEWCPITRSSVSDWEKNVETIVQWSPYTTEEDLLCQFHLMRNHGTKIIIYNLWEDDQGMLELDFDTDPQDIQLRGVNRDQKNIDMASQYPNSRHFLTYKHSLRSYASILYLKLPRGFRIILRGKDVEHHNIIDDMMQTENITYKPREGADGCANYSNMSAVVTIGFVKDAKYHVDVQGFNVYHKNRLIKPFWRIWNAAGSDGRGVIGFLEANFVEPAHDKQGFERTTVLSRLEARLIQMQKNYWRSNCHNIGYAPRQGKKSVKDSEDIEEPSEYVPKGSGSSRKRIASSSFKSSTSASERFNKRSGKGSSFKTPTSTSERFNTRSGKGSSFKTPTSASERFNTRSNVKAVKGSSLKTPTTASEKINSRSSLKGGKESVKESKDNGPNVKGGERSVRDSKDNGSVQTEKFGKARNSSSIYSKQTKPQGARDEDYGSDSSPERNITELPEKISELPEAQSGTGTLKQENKELKERLSKKEEVLLLMQKELRREKELRKTLEDEVQTLKDKLEDMEKEQSSLIDIFAEDREKRDKEEEELRNKLNVATETIQKLLG